jgi:hypothetical protein
MHPITPEDIRRGSVRIPMHRADGTEFVCELVFPDWSHQLEIAQQFVEGPEKGSLQGLVAALMPTGVEDANEHLRGVGLADLVELTSVAQRMIFGDPKALRATAPAAASPALPPAGPSSEIDSKSSKPEPSATATPKPKAGASSDSPGSLKL